MSLVKPNTFVFELDLISNQIDIEQAFIQAKHELRSSSSWASYVYQTKIYLLKLGSLC